MMSARIVRTRGFTLIELLVVIAVIGVLAAAVLGAINPLEQINKAKDTTAKNDAAQLQASLERFYTTFGCYPWDYTVGTGCAGVLTQFNGGAVAAVGAAAVPTPVTGTMVVQNELKPEFGKRLLTQTVATNKDVLILSSSAPADPDGYLTHVCFIPSSKSFTTLADRDVNGNNWASGTKYICVP